MKERPILFSAPMVRAILDGRKTQTRRAVKPQPDPESGWENQKDLPSRCPYGVPGDRLWAKETWWKPSDFWLPRGRWKTGGRTAVRYCADGAFEHFDIDRTQYDRLRVMKPGKKSSLHLPRWLSRTTLEITGVRVERLQAISEADAISEGAERNDSPGNNPEWEPDWGYRTRCIHYPNGCECFPHYTAKEWFEDVWKSINGEGSWAANPWVWVIEFRRVP